MIESLEARELLSTTFTVTNAGDNGNNAAPLSGSLRAAIVQADALAPGTASTIKFAIPGGAFQTINPPGPAPPDHDAGDHRRHDPDRVHGHAADRAQRLLRGRRCHRPVLRQHGLGHRVRPDAGEGIQIFSFNGGA